MSDSEEDHHSSTESSDSESVPGASQAASEQVDALAADVSRLKLGEKSIMDRLVKNKEPVLLLGESHTRALSIALAVMRRSLEGIWATSYSNNREPPLWECNYFKAKVLQIAKERASKNAKNGLSYFTKKIICRIILVGPGTTLPPKIQRNFVEFEQYLEDLEDQDLVKNLCLEGDATKLECINVAWGTRPHIIWFQAPWLPHGKLPGLLENFFKSASEFQDVGDIIILDLTTNDFFRPRYGEYEDAASEHGYTERKEPQQEPQQEPGPDLIQECGRYGYQHMSYANRRETENGMPPSDFISHIFEKLE